MCVTHLSCQSWSKMPAGSTLIALLSRRMSLDTRRGGSQPSHTPPAHARGVHQHAHACAPCICAMHMHVCTDAQTHTHTHTRARRQGKRGAAARGCVLWHSGRRPDKLGAGMRALARAPSAPTQTHVALHSANESIDTRDTLDTRDTDVMPLLYRFR
jgi:hypothetical protein